MVTLVTGASGFVGSALVASAETRGISVRSVLRFAGVKERSVMMGDDVAVMESITAESDWTEALENVESVVHCAARVHVMSDTQADSKSLFNVVNVQGTLNLASQAANAGVKRFVFISSIKVNGESTKPGCCFLADDLPSPKDDYAISKAEAESGLRQIGLETGMEVVIIRPPLVYGPGVKGNFNSLLKWVQRGRPLPLGSVTQNRRSLVALTNLVDLIFVCLVHPNAANQTFLISDGEDISTADLLRYIGVAFCRKVYLPRVPLRLLILLGNLTGKEAIAQRLLGSMQINIDKTCRLLNWTPPISINEELQRMIGQR